MKYTFKRIKTLVWQVRSKGVRYVWNKVHFFFFWHKIRKYPFLVKLLNWLAPYPTCIEIEVTTRCNLKCIMCEHTYWNEPNKDMSFEQFKYIVDQFPKLKWIGLTGIGESFLNKDFIKMLKYIKSKDIFIELYDTFFFINERTAKELIVMELDKILASIDAATKETYEKLRVGSNFERVINNIKFLFKIKRKINAKFPEIDFHYIVNRFNIQEIPQYIDLVHSISQGDETSIQFTRMLHEFKEVEDMFLEIPEEIVKQAEEKAKIHGIRLRWNSDVPAIKPSMNRCIEWTMPFIFVTGHVIPCCSGNEAGQRQFQKDTAMGNVFNHNFLTMWRGRKYKKLRSAIRKGKVPLPCNNCCLYDSGDN